MRDPFKDLRGPDGVIEIPDLPIPEKQPAKARRQHAWFECTSLAYLNALVEPTKTYTLEGKRMSRPAWLREVHRQLVNEIKRQQRRERAVIEP